MEERRRGERKGVKTVMREKVMTGPIMKMQSFMNLLQEGQLQIKRK